MRVLHRGLPGVAHNPQIIERTAAALALRICGAQIVDDDTGGAALIGQILLHRLTLTSQEAGDSEVWLHRGKQLGLLLHYLCESLFHQAV